MDGMSVLDTAGVTPAQLREMAAEVERRWPGAILVKNQVGNLNVTIVDGDDYWDVAWCDLRNGEVSEFDDSSQ